MSAADDAVLPEFAATADDFFDRTQPLLASQPGRAAEVGQAALEHAEASGDEAGAIRSLLLLGMAYDALGRSERDALLKGALRRAERLADPVLLIRAVTSQMVVDIYQGRYAEALVRGRSMLGMAYVLSRDDLLWRLLNNLAIALNLIGEFEPAIGMFDECLRLLQGETPEIRIHRARTVNNQAMAWLGIAKLTQLTDAPGGDQALDTARALAESACRQMLDENHLSLRLSTLDTLVSVLLQQHDADSAMHWVERVALASGDQLAVGSMHWGAFALVLSRVDLARPDVDVVEVLTRLRQVEALPGPRFRGGEMQAMLHLCLANALERSGAQEEALRYHRQWLQFEARTQSLLAREHAMAVHHTLDSLRGETEEFVTHDLRNPLGAALVQIDSVSRELSFDSQAVGRLAKARSGVQKALGMADHYLAIVRARNLRRAGLVRIDMAELVDDVGERLAPPAGGSARLLREIEWGLELRGDRILLLTAFDLLLRTALEQAPAGRAVSWTLCGGQGEAVLSVEGWGLDALTSSSTGRTLAAVMLARVAQLHDSQMVSAPGEGGATCLQWRFPLAADSAPAMD